MDAKEILVFGFLCAIIGVTVSELYLLGYFQFLKDDVDLAICILSARNNFKQRDAIRQSWLTDITTVSDRSVMAKFVIGKEDCPIHPQDRLNVHECERWNPVLPDPAADVAAFSLKSTDYYTEGQIVHSVYVKVMHDVILKRLGLMETMPFDQLHPNETIQVILYDAVTNDEVTSAHFTSSQRGIHSNGYLYRPVQELLLPKDFHMDGRVTAGVDSPHQTDIDMMPYPEDLCKDDVIPMFKLDVNLTRRMSVGFAGWEDAIESEMSLNMKGY